ncbi:MAG: 4-hydroxy-tetrahydrodipicolinate synthase [Thermodesulfobacteriota bacterium]|nr:4-hydroxy-tetrahydrodipicolinate synthase [Thermodesulfobacteriota bacterium]
MTPGCYTALITPFDDHGVDEEGLSRLVAFQMENGIAGIVAVGTTGESPTLTWDEHNRVTELIARQVKGLGICIAGTGSNNTAETLSATEHSVRAGADAVLLVDPYYNGPSSLEIRREYIEPVARAFPDTRIIPYVVPGRTGAQVLPEDLALASQRFANVDTVKEATGNLENMRRTRRCCGDAFNILSGDDNLVFQMMTDPEIRACGVISVYSNIFPGAMSRMVAALDRSDKDEGRKISLALSPLLERVTVTSTEETPLGPVTCRARNPLPVKTLMALLGMPSGFCRQPLGRMTAAGLDSLTTAARKVFTGAPELFTPLAEFFGIDVEARLFDGSVMKSLVYPDY